MTFYPMFVDLRQRRCIVVGGGVVAERRIEGLLAAGANLTLISPSVTARLEALATQGSIRLLSRGYEKGDLTGFDLVFVASDDNRVNQAVLADARAENAWVNSADDPENCDFILPAVIRRGDIALAISTGGVSPATTRLIREELESYLTSEYASLARIAGEVRRTLREKSIAASPRAWNEALRGEFRRLLKEDRGAEAKKLLLKSLGAES
jgi:precorrin-2 dehydrogenase/sirohydrochlorin ferrochelatase